MKKKFLLSVILFLAFRVSFSQNIQDLGKMSFIEAKNINEIEPCDITVGKALTYCSEDGNKITYLFDNDKLYSTMFWTAFLNRSKAEIELERVISNFEIRNNTKPAYKNGSAYFFLPSSPLTVSYSIGEFKGTTYLFYSTFISKD